VVAGNPDDFLERVVEHFHAAQRIVHGHDRKLVAVVVPVAHHDAGVGTEGLGLFDEPFDEVEIVLIRDGRIGRPSEVNVRQRDGFFEYGFDKFSESGFYNLSYSHLYSPLTGLIRCIETTDNEKLDRDRYSTDDELGTAIACALGRSRACRENNLNNTFELIPEMFAQYMLTGKITLNTAPTHFTFNGVEHTILWDQEPERNRYGVMTDKAKFTEMVNDFIKRAEDLFASWLDWSKGQIVAL
jgi:hypothetical protein